MQFIINCLDVSQLNIEYVASKYVAIIKTLPKAGAKTFCLFKNKPKFILRYFCIFRCDLSKTSAVIDGPV